MKNEYICKDIFLSAAKILASTTMAAHAICYTTEGVMGERVQSLRERVQSAQLRLMYRHEQCIARNN